MIMKAKFNTPEEEKAYQVGKLEGMLGYQQHLIKNVELEYEKLYKKRMELEKPEKS